MSYNVNQNVGLSSGTIMTSKFTYPTNFHNRNTNKVFKLETLCRAGRFPEDAVVGALAVQKLKELKLISLQTPVMIRNISAVLTT